MRGVGDAGGARSLHLLRFPLPRDTGYMFPAPGTSCMFSRAWHRLHVFPRLTPVKRFLALDTGYVFSRAWHQLHVSRARHQLHVFLRLAPVTCFPALGTSYMSSCAWHRLRVFPPLAPVTFFPALDTDYMFSTPDTGYNHNNNLSSFNDNRAIKPVISQLYVFRLLAPVARFCIDWPFVRLSFLCLASTL